MKPVIGPAGEIIGQAISLGILCRPVEIGWRGEALQPDHDSFEHVIAASNHFVGLYHPSPAQIVRDWELTTKDLITKEFEDSIKEFEDAQKPPF